MPVVALSSYAKMRDRARERFIGPALCAETGVGDGASASIDSFALAGPIVISLLLSAAGVLLDFYNKVIHRRAKYAVVQSIVRSTSFVRTLSKSSSAVSQDNGSQGGKQEIPADHAVDTSLPGAPSETAAEQGSAST